MGGEEGEEEVEEEKEKEEEAPVQGNDNQACPGRSSRLAALVSWWSRAAATSRSVSGWC